MARGMFLLHDTLSGKRRPPASGDGRPVSVYLCGVTVYDDAHVGHARTVIVFDVLRRYLQRRGVRVRMVQNFTDVDDKIIARARAEGVTADVIGNRYIGRYRAEFERLNVLRADLYPRATEHIGDIVSFVADLIRKGSAYVSENGVYFAVSSFGRYGMLSKKRVDELKSGARIEVDAAKRDPLDFALWKFDDGDPSWDSPWGRGRPGWHIECSAMSIKHLGERLDIHGGGRDLIFPHHENEIAQSESRTGGEFARIWMHVGMVTIQGEKMSKSLGNIRSVGRALADWGPNVIRLFCLSGHYSKPVDYSEGNLQESLVRWRQLEACLCELRCAVRSGAGLAAADTTTADTTTADTTEADAEALQGAARRRLAMIRERFDAALDDDLNTHLAISALMEIVSETNGLVAADGIGGRPGAGWAAAAMSEMSYMMDVLGLSPAASDESESMEIDARIAERAALRDEGRYGEADAIRDSLGGRGIELIDRVGGTVWVKREPIGRDGR